jgi:RimJ/RimL family protein N-acetyltransferase
MSSTFLFYRCDTLPTGGVPRTLPTGYAWRLWAPDRGGLAPHGLSIVPFGIWTAMHRLRLFSNGEYRVLVVYFDGRLVHRSGLYPRYARFPFMAREDVQIGDVWTDPGHRNRGLASFALQALVGATVGQGRRVWYVVETSNAPSIRTVEKIGFARVGTGARTKRLGLALLGQFVLAPGQDPA